jgi:membrane protein YqaA with SNARE-associated domain
MDLSGSAYAELAFLFLASFLIPTFNFISPLRPIIIILGLSTHLPPLTVGLVASVGTTLGALPLYFVGRKLQSLDRVKNWLVKHPKIDRFMQKISHKPFLVVLCLLWFPFPDELVGLYGGFERYNVWKFLLANFIGRVVWYIPLALFGSDIVGWFWSAWHWLGKVF